MSSGKTYSIEPTAGPRRKGAPKVVLVGVTVRLTPAELSRLDANRARVRLGRGPYLRSVAFRKLPHVIPELNQKGWTLLVAAGQHLAELAERSGDLTDFGAESAKELRRLADLLSVVRCHLIGAGLSGDTCGDSEDQNDCSSK